ncbi:MAG TPA: hypothetical protein VEP91_04885 [Solirubrobacterales bacterium]|nr:hypothetical protein [Solirubrobacterales bacterium]
MSPPAISTEIQDLEGRIESLRGEMSAPREKLLDVAGSFLGDFWLKRAREAVKKNPEVAGQLGAPGIKALRVEVDGMANRGQELARTHLFQNRREIWPDQWSVSELLTSDSVGSTFDYYSRGKSVGGPAPAGFLEVPLALAAGLVGQVLQNCGLPLGRDFESTWDQASGSSALQARFVGWSEEMAEAANSYAEQVGDLFDAAKKLKRLKREKEEGEAVDLWDQAAS